jgi:3-hydroxyacyl-CoA dehydrogenase
MAAWRGTGQVKTVTVIGAGLIGAGWVAAFLAHGFAVRVHDPAADAPDKVRSFLDRTLPELASMGRASVPALPQSGNLSFHTDLANAVTDADFVQENTPERPETKSALFADLDRLLPPDVIVASSTSSLPITELVAGCVSGARFVLGHPFNPVHLMPLVELGGGERTDPAAIDTADELYISMGKRPVRVRREIFGHIANRLTSAMFREAVSLVANGVATVEDVDNALRYGPALKWAIQGQFTTFHTSGGDRGLAGFLEHFSPGIIRRWQSMTTPDLADPALQAKLIEQFAAAHVRETPAEIAERQDEMLVALIKALIS